MKLLDIDTAPKRARLPARKNPYWRAIAGGRGGVTLGYRRPARGVGSWVAKLIVDGRRVEERIGVADDPGAPSVAISYRSAVAAALEWSERQQVALRADAVVGRRKPTVQVAVEDYSAIRKARSPRHGRIAADRLAMYVLADASFAATPLSRLQASTIEAWRDQLPMRPQGVESVPGRRGVGGLAPATIDRLLGDLRAALNLAGVKYRREMPGSYAMEVRIGTKALGAPSEARQQLLSDTEVRGVVEAAYTIDDSGDFGRLVLLAAATGARYSQVVAVKVGDLQPDRGRVMMPGSRKGRSHAAKTPVAVPLDPETMRRLLPTAAGRQASEPLLKRWHHKVVRRGVWARDFRRGWGPAYEVTRLWNTAARAAELPAGTVMYALRHSSVVRGLRAGLPVRLVAALHDTSVQMIERHYAAYIVDMTEDLARRAALTFAGPGTYENSSGDARPADCNRKSVDAHNRAAVA